MNKKIIISLAVLLSVNLNAYAQNKNVPYDFKGIRLGIPYSEYKEMKIPEVSSFSMGTSKDSEPFLVCSDDKRASAFATPDSVQKKYNGIGCNYGITTNYHPQVPPSYTTARIIVAGYGADNYAFKFAQLPGDAEPILYEIFFLIHRNAFNSISSGLIEKYGKPKVSRTQVQNKYGANFGNEVFVWENSVSVVVLEERYTDLETSSLKYELKSFKKLFAKERQELSKQTNQM